MPPEGRRQDEDDDEEGGKDEDDEEGEGDALRLKAVLCPLCSLGLGSHFRRPRLTLR